MILARVHTKTKTRERRERKKAQPIVLSVGSHIEKKRNRRRRRRTAFVMTERLVLMVVLCDLEKVVRTDAAKEERKIAEDIYVNVCVNKILCDVFLLCCFFLFFLSPSALRFQISSQRTLKGRKPHQQHQQQQRYNSRWCLK